MATSAPAIAVRQPTALAATTDTPAAYSNIVLDTPHPTHAPERNASLLISDHPLIPALSALHISPEIPPTRERKITIQSGISAKASCSLGMSSRSSIYVLTRVQKRD
jgi:hypothetical protein